MAENILLRIEKKTPQLKPQNVEQILLSLSMVFPFKKILSILLRYSQPSSPTRNIKKSERKTNAMES